MANYTQYGTKTLKNIYRQKRCDWGLEALENMQDRKNGNVHSMAGWLTDTRSQYKQQDITGTHQNGYIDGILRHARKGQEFLLPDGKTEKVLAVAEGASKRTIIFNDCVVKFNQHANDHFGNQTSAELNTWLIAVNEGWSELLCPIVRGGGVRSDRASNQTEQMQSYIVQAKADCEREIDYKEYDELVKKLRSHGVVDQHRGNVAYYNGRLVSIDYGLSR